MRDPLFFQIIQLVGASPELLVLTIAGVICLRRLPNRPREGWLAGVAIALFVFAKFGISNLISLILTNTGGFVNSNLLVAYLAYGIPMSLAQATAWGLILYAAFGAGSGPSSKDLVESDDESES